MIENISHWSDTRVLGYDEKLNWLRLIRSDKVGPATFFRLMDRFGSVGTVLNNLPDLARQGGQRRYRACSEDTAVAELDRIDAANAKLIAWCEPEYPPLLRHIEGAPPVISVIGRTALAQQSAIAVVGARNASANGLGFTRTLAHHLGLGGYGHQGVVVVSGMARGIDAAAHHGSLEHGTIAVLGGGVDVAYPADNARLYDEISEKGLVIAEMPIGTRPSAHLFPIRNRIISGIVAGVVIVEAAQRSGSLITARLALDQGREVFAVPGAPGDPRARGTNGLIRDGAILVESAADVLKSLGPAEFHPQHSIITGEDEPVSEEPASGNDVDKARKIIKELLGNSPVAVDELVRNCQFSFPTVSAVLLEMELAGRLERHPGNRVCRIVVHE